MKLIKVILFSFVSLLLIFVSAISDDKPQAETKVILPDSADKIIDTAMSAEQEITDKIIAYYFHGIRRCFTCKKIELYSQEAIESTFKKELESGRLEFHPVNFDEEENKHFIKDYELYKKLFQRAKEKNLLADLWNAVGEHFGYDDFKDNHFK